MATPKNNKPSPMGRNSDFAQQELEDMRVDNNDELKISEVDDKTQFAVADHKLDKDIN